MKPQQAGNVPPMWHHNEGKGLRGNGFGGQPRRGVRVPDSRPGEAVMAQEVETDRARTKERDVESGAWKISE